MRFGFYCFGLFKVPRVALGIASMLASMTAPCQAGTVTFGSGSNQFNMEFVTIGNPGNAADTTGDPNPAGAVGYEYGIGKFEVSEDMITKYNANFGTANSLAITKDTRGTNKPATSVSWNKAARFVFSGAPRRQLDQQRQRLVVVDSLRQRP